MLLLLTTSVGSVSSRSFMVVFAGFVVRKWRAGLRTQTVPDYSAAAGALIQTAFVPKAQYGVGQGRVLEL